MLTDLSIARGPCRPRKIFRKQTRKYFNTDFKSNSRATANLSFENRLEYPMIPINGIIEGMVTGNSSVLREKMIQYLKSRIRTCQKEIHSSQKLSN